MATINDVVRRLRGLTETGKLKWEHMTPPASLVVGNESKIIAFFGTTVKNRRVGIYEERYHSYFDPDTEKSYWDSRIVLAFFDSSWDVSWETPTSAGVSELYDAIKYRATNVDAIMQDILDESLD
jgi:hypothetical protein